MTVSKIVTSRTRVGLAFLACYIPLVNDYVSFRNPCRSNRHQVGSSIGHPQHYPSNSYAIGIMPELRRSILPSTVQTSPLETHTRIPHLHLSPPWMTRCLTSLAVTSKFQPRRRTPKTTPTFTIIGSIFSSSRKTRVTTKASRQAKIKMGR